MCNGFGNTEGIGNFSSVFLYNDGGSRESMCFEIFKNFIGKGVEK